MDAPARQKQFEPQKRPIVVAEKNKKQPDQIEQLELGDEPRTVPPVDAVRHGNSYYKYYPKRKIRWNDADLACKKRNGQLAIAPDNDRKTFLQQLKGDDKVAWIGATVGSDGKLRWLGGEPVTGKTSGSGKNQNYLSIGISGQFKLRWVGGKGRGVRFNYCHGYICEWPAEAEDADANEVDGL